MLDIFKNASTNEVMDTLDEIKKKQNDYKRYVNNNPNKFTKYANLKQHKTKYRQKVFSLPSVVYWSNPKYWEEVLKSKKLQRQHPEFQVKY